MHGAALIGCIVTILAWGVASIFDKIAMRGIDPVSGVLVRMVFVTTVVLGFCALTGRVRPIFEFAPQTHMYLIISALFGGLIGQLAYYVAIKHAPATIVVPVVATYPVIAFALAVLFLREHVSVIRVSGVVLVVVGLMLISSGKRNGAGSDGGPLGWGREMAATTMADSVRGDEQSDNGGL